MKPQEIKEKLVNNGVPDAQAQKFVSYVEDQLRQDKSKEEKKKSGASRNGGEALVSIFMRLFGVGVTIDGINAVVTGRDMAMVTYHGYKNKVLTVYPESLIDIQLVRETDKFSFSKSDGKVTYTHEFGDPFNDKPIVGAYAIIKNKRGEFLELLNKNDFEEMKGASKQSYLWNTWASEFWLKSVIKRACKRHFNDIVAEIDKLDNDDYGLSTDYISKKTPWTPSETRPMSEHQKFIVDNLLAQKGMETDDSRNEYMWDNYGVSYSEMTESHAQQFTDDFKSEVKQERNGER